MAIPDYDLPSYISARTDYVFSGGGSGSVAGGSALSRFRYRKTSSVNTPGYFTKKQKRLALPFNPYSRVVAELDDPMTNWTVNIQWISGPLNGYSQVNTYTGNCRFLGVPMESNFVADDPMPKAVARLREELSLAKTNTSVAMAEASKTANHVAKTATRLYNAFRALKRMHLGDFTEALGITASRSQQRRFYRRKRRVLKIDTPGQQTRITAFAAETWLEYSYAWKPLLKDVYDHCEALASAAVKTDFLFRRARGSAKTVGVHVFSGVDQNNCFDWKVRQDTVRRASIEVNYRLPLSGISNILALGVANPLEVVWEVVPFSFVVDWFLPVGDLIRSFSAYNGLTFMSGFTTSSTTSTKELSFVANGRTVPGGADTTYRGSGSGQASTWGEEKNRLPIYDFPNPPSLEFKDPRSFAHAASAIALLQVIFLQGGTKGMGNSLRI